MPVAVCSLIWNSAAGGAARQRVTYDDDGYYLVRFPYGAAEASDVWNMHSVKRGGDTDSAFPDRRSGLIWPSHDGWGVLSASVFWARDAKPTEFRARFVRDPLGLAGGYDSTATTDATRTGGGQYKSYVWQIFVNTATPLGLKISARGAGNKRITTPITMAQFKLAIHTDVLKP